jgi:hypothetical protein
MMWSISLAPMVWDFQPRDTAMRNIRLGADLRAATIILGAAVIANCTAQAQTTGDATEGKRVQVLQIVETGSTKAISVKKSKSTGTGLKKKVVGRNPVRHARRIASDAVLKQITSIDPSGENAGVLPEKDEGAIPSSEQTGTLSFGDRAVAFAALSGDPEKLEAPPNANSGVKETSAAGGAFTESPALPTDRARQAGVSSSPTSQLWATLSGATLASVFGWYLVTSNRRRGSRELI